jgi:hypothetical protein
MSHSHYGKKERKMRTRRWRTPRSSLLAPRSSLKVDHEDPPVNTDQLLEFMDKEVGVLKQKEEEEDAIFECNDDDDDEDEKMDDDEAILEEEKKGVILGKEEAHSTNSDAEKVEPDSERRRPSAKKRSRVEEVTNANTVADTKNGSWYSQRRFNVYLHLKSKKKQCRSSLEQCREGTPFSEETYRCCSSPSQECHPYILSN